MDDAEKIKYKDIIHAVYKKDGNILLKPEYYFHWQKYKEKGIFYYYFVGVRSAGKTYDGIKWLVDEGRGILVRRTAPEFDIMCDEVHSPFNPLIEVGDLESGYVKRSKKIYKLYANDEWIADGVTLNTFATTRSADYTYFKNIFWDEFIKQPDQKEMRAEGSAWLSMIHTIVRNRTDVTVVAAANSNDIYNPVFKELGVINHLEKLMNDKKEGSKIYTDYKRHIKIVLFEPCYELKKFLELTAVHDLTEGTRYADMAFSNEFIGNDFTDCGYKSIKGYKPIIAIDDFTAWRKKGSNEIYVSYASCEGVKQYYSKYELDQENIREHYYTFFRNRYLKHLITFESYAIKRTFLDILKLI